jgi:hypothetical protein
MTHLFDANHILIFLFAGGIVAVLYRWLIATEDRRRYADYMDGGLWAWIAFSGMLYMGDAQALGHDGFDGGFGGDGGAGCGGCGGGG